LFSVLLTLCPQVEIDPGLLSDSALAAIAAQGTTIYGESEDVTGPGATALAMIDQHTRNQMLPQTK